MYFRKNIYLSIGLMFVALLVSGCGAKGEKFQSFKNPDNGKSLIYIYRPSSFVGSGVFYDIHTSTNNNQDNVIGTLRNGGYIETEIEPGEVEVWGKTESKSSVTLDAQANNMYCVKGTVGIGLLVGRPHLSIVSNETCALEIQSTQKSY